MQLTDFARKVPEDVWTLFEPILPPVVWCGNGCPPYDRQPGVSASRALRPRHRDWVADVAPRFSVLQNRATATQGLVGPGCLSDRLATTGPTL
jgi:hypothetical protein